MAQFPAPTEGIALTPRSRLELSQHPCRPHRRSLWAVERPRSGVSDPADQPGQRDPLLHARPRRAPDRGWPAGQAPV